MAESKPLRVSNDSNQVLTTEEMIERSDNWKLSCDNALLNRLKQFSKSISETSQDITRDCDSLSIEINDLQSQVVNVTNEFLMLSNTQFIENRVQDFIEISSGPKTSQIQLKSKAEKEEELISKMKEAIQIGLHTDKNCDPSTKYTITTPHLIGSSKFYSSQYRNIMTKTVKKEDNLVSLFNEDAAAQLRTTPINETRENGDGDKYFSSDDEIDNIPITKNVIEWKESDKKAVLNVSLFNEGDVPPLGATPPDEKDNEVKSFSNENEDIDEIEDIPVAKTSNSWNEPVKEAIDNDSLFGEDNISQLRKTPVYETREKRDKYFSSDDEIKEIPIPKNVNESKRKVASNVSLFNENDVSQLRTSPTNKTQEKEVKSFSNEEKTEDIPKTNNTPKTPIAKNASTRSESEKKTANVHLPVSEKKLPFSGRKLFDSDSDDDLFKPVKPKVGSSSGILSSEKPKTLVNYSLFDDSDSDDGLFSPIKKKTPKKEILIEPKKGLDLFDNPVMNEPLDLDKKSDPVNVFGNNAPHAQDTQDEVDNKNVIKTPSVKKIAATLKFNPLTLLPRTKSSPITENSDRSSESLNFEQPPENKNLLKSVLKDRPKFNQRRLPSKNWRNQMKQNLLPNADDEEEKSEASSFDLSVPIYSDSDSFNAKNDDVLLDKDNPLDIFSTSHSEVPENSLFHSLSEEEEDVFAMPVPQERKTQLFSSTDDSDTETNQFHHPLEL